MDPAGVKRTQMISAGRDLGKRSRYRCSTTTEVDEYHGPQGLCGHEPICGTKLRFLPTYNLAVWFERQPFTLENNTVVRALVAVNLGEW